MIRTRIEVIYDHMVGDSFLEDTKNNKPLFDTYFPNQHLKECTKPYVVIRDEGKTTLQSYSSELLLFSLMVYVPEGRFTDLERLVDKVEEHMKGLYPLFKSTRFRTPSFFDDTVKAHMISTQYQTPKKSYNY